MGTRACLRSRLRPMLPHRIPFALLAHCLAMRFRAPALASDAAASDSLRASRALLRNALPRSGACVRCYRIGFPSRFSRIASQCASALRRDTEREGFEPSVPGWVQLLSREPDSAALAPLRSGATPEDYTPAGCRRLSLAERVGFEPTEPGGLNGFQDRLIRPL